MLVMLIDGLPCPSGGKAGLFLDNACVHLSKSRSDWARVSIYLA